MSARHVLRWVGAQSFVAAPVAGAPTVLRFDSDDFMDRLLAMLADAPQTLPSFVATHESWLALAEPTPAPALAAPRSAPARALVRQRGFLGFNRTGLAAVQPPAAAPKPLKLFQPVQQRFYVAAAHLVCELPGLPTRATAGGDKSGMLMRRLLSDGRECAFVKAPGQPSRWVPLTDVSQPLPGEEWLSLFPLAYRTPDNQPRKLLAALVPAARHDDYRFSSVGPAPTLASSRAAALKAGARMKLIAPWQGLIERARASRDSTGGAQTDKPWDDDTTARDNAAAASLPKLNDQLQESSWRLLQDMAEWLKATLPAVHGALDGGALAPGSAGQALLTLLEQAAWGPGQRAWVAPVLSTDLQVIAASVATTLRQALVEIGRPAKDGHPSVSDALDATQQAFPANVSTEGGAWPPFSFPLVVATNATVPAAAPPPGRTRDELAGPFNNATWLPAGPGDDADPQDVAQRRLETFYNAVALAIDEALRLDTVGSARAQAPDAARMATELQATLAAETGPPRYMLRFVHQRCDCGPLHPAVMSAPSDVFELAGFFDPEAPLRPIRIALPFDTSPGGLRKFGKNSAFIMSDLLCGQMKRVRRLGFGDLVLSVLPWPFHKDLSVPDGGPCGGSGAGSFGTICSLSIPIITIVAFILLIVIATLLDLIFRWLPFLMVCFPIPGLKGKK